MGFGKLSNGVIRRDPVWFGLVWVMRFGSLGRGWVAWDMVGFGKDYKHWQVAYR